MEATRGDVVPRFERAITWTRLAGAVAVVLVAPFLPNLGPIAIGLLAGTLALSAVVLHWLSGRIRSTADARRFSWITFWWDVVVIFFAMLLLSPDPMWAILPLIGVIFIVTTTFRLGPPAALVAAAVMAASMLGIALWRDMALGLAVSPAHIGFVLTMYVLTALVVTSMLREYDRLHAERETLLRQDRERTQLLEHEREARTAAEVAITRLGAVERISERVLLHDSVGALLQEALAAIAAALDARAGAVLTTSGDWLAVRATFGLSRRPRSRIPPDDVTIAAELESAAMTTIHSRTLVRLHSDGVSRGRLYLGFDRDQDLAAPDRELLDTIASRLAFALGRAERFDAEREARTAAENEAERARLLVRAADAASASGDARERFDRLARLAVPSIGDTCAIFLLRSPERLECVALAARAAEIERDMWMIDHREPRVRRDDDPLWEVLERGEPRRIQHVGPEDLDRLARGPEQLRMLLDRESRSWLAVPILAEGRTLGAIELYDGASGRSFDEDDIETARSFAARVAVAAAAIR